MAEQEGDAYKNSEHLHDGKNLARYKGTTTSLPSIGNVSECLC